VTGSSASAPNEADLATIAAEHLRSFAREPRPSGEAQVAAAREYCARVLTSLGFATHEKPFEYSAAVGEYGTPAAGVLVALVSLLALGLHSRLVLLLGAAVLALGARWLARRGVLRLPILRRRGVNLEARRGASDPNLWLVAHVDSKSQPIPLLLRAAGIVLVAIAWVGALFWTMDFLYVAIVCSLPVIASIVGRNSAGAVDNASGVATVLAATTLLPPDRQFGVLITDAEELGLAGARAWCAGRSPSIALNCDGVDDTGPLTLMWTRPRPRRLEKAFRGTKGLRVIRLVPGVLADSVAFSDAGWEAVTLSRGTLRTLLRIHTRRDSLEHLRGSGLGGAALALASAAITLTERR
jgi:acetylornithine deacetylase/succinyl-diaminopimelate desuccinylase-like protein